MTHTPEQGKILRFDFKDGLTLHLLDGLPHLWKLPGEANPCPTITSVEEALNVFEALLKEHSNRTRVLKQARLENIYQFNREYPNERIPPIFCLFEEVAGFNAQASRMEGKVAETALKLIHEMVSLFRATGISFLFTTQYPANRCGMTPEIRACLGSGVCFRTTSQAASLVFGDEDSFFTNQVSRLTGMGDSLVKQPGILKPVHCQGFDLPTEQLKTFVSAMGQLYGSLLDDSLNQLIG
jgi:DNA segregation ATPase FtsK/SpoIIIE-like protein